MWHQVMYFISVLCIIVIIYFGTGKEIERAANYVDVDLENWMRNLPDDLRKAPITNLAIPGSHDSFTSNITSSSLVSQSKSKVFTDLKVHSLDNIILSRWSKTQNYSVTGQLNVGIRYFDLRFCLDSNTDVLYFCHGLYSIEVQSVLKDMVRFLDNHPKEVVLLDCQHFYDFQKSTYIDVINRLKNVFGEKVIPYQSNMESLTLDYLYAQKQQVLVVFRNSDYSGLDFLWPDKYMLNPWYDTTNSTYLIHSLNEGLKNKPSSVGYVSQLVMTANAKYIFEHFSSSIYEKFAVEFESKRTTWISNQITGKHGVNIIIVDFVELSNNSYSKIIVNLNLKSKIT